MSQLPQIPRLVAILVGINKYTNHPQLINKTATGADDANKLYDFLVNEVKVDSNDITLLLDSAATRDGIIKALESQSLKEARRDTAILFYFSGYTGVARPDQDNNRVGMICPSDMGTGQSGTPGIPDKTLIQLFDNISTVRGNNIAVFLDCGTEVFTWENPSSFTLVAPKSAVQTENGGMFTDVLISVLRSEFGMKSIQLLTVQSLADKIKVKMGVAVHCYGQNVDRILFNPTKARAYHVFISVNTMKNGSIMLLAGSAHGVQKDTIYGIYPSNVVLSKNTILGHLRVSSVDSATSSTLSPLEPEDALALTHTVFYAVEIRYEDETMKVFFPDKTHKINTPSGEEVEDPKKANITLRITQDRVGFSCNGVIGDREELRDTEPVDLFSLPLNDPHTMRTIRSAARFMYHLSRLSPDDSSLSVNVQFKEVVAKQPSGQNLLDDGLFAKLHVSKKKVRGPFCIILRNNSPNVDAVWPFIFICDPRGFNILPWYVPHPAATEAPLKRGGSLTVGCGNEGGLQFRWRGERKSEVSYVKIFLTTERTSFSSLIQYFKSPNEDKFREVNNPTRYSATESEGTYEDISQLPSSNQSHEAEVNPIQIGQESEWATMRITIKQMYT